MVISGCLKPTEIYDAVDWNVIFLLAGVIPLGIAMEQTGAAEWLAALVVAGSADFAPLVVLGVFYLLTSLLTNLVSNNASVVLLIPVAFDCRHRHRGQRVFVRVGGHLRGVDCFYYTSRLPDEPDGVRPWRLPILGLLPGRRTPAAPVGGRHHAVYRVAVWCMTPANVISADN